MMRRSRRLSGLSVVVATGSVALMALTLPACGADTTGVFETTSGQGGSTSSSGDGGASSSSGLGGSGGQPGTGGMGSGGQPGTGGGQAGSGGQTTSSGSGGPVDPENCQDGLDNDKDGAIDCADSDCVAGFVCTDAPPSGWSTVTLEQGTGAAPSPTPCDDGTAAEQLFTGPAGAAECSACTCGNLAGNTCAPPPVSCYPGSTGCGGNNPQDWTNNFGNNACAKPGLPIGTGQLSCRLTGTAAVTAPGSCTPSVSDFANKETWAGWVQACPVKAAGGGCGDGFVCAPKPSSDTQSLCMRQDGQKTCPSGWTQVDAYTSGKDDRSCNSCACEPSPTCTGGSYRFFDGNQCPANETPTAIDSATCRDVSSLLDFGSYSIQRVLPTAGGSCTATGGDAIGSVQTEGPVTFCCK